MTIRYDEHPAMFKSNPLGFVLAVLLIAAAGLGILILLWWYLKCKSTHVVIDDDTVILERGLLSKEKIELDLNRIRTVKIYQSFFNRIFGVGRISLYSAGDAPEFVVEGMPDPNRFRELIKGANNNT